MPSSLEYIRNGKLRALAVTTATRSPALPDIPTIGEFLPGYESSTWHDVGLPKNTPTEIIDKLNKEINASLADPASGTRLAELGTTVIGGAGRVEKLIAEGTEKWARVTKFVGLDPSIGARQRLLQYTCRVICSISR
jgi:tripartite-type tricarboxylate transporter receptor subunit TctC